MKFIFALLIFLCSVAAQSQQRFEQFPGTGFGLILPDSNFRYTEHGFTNSKYRASIALVNPQTDPQDEGSNE